MNYSSRFWLLPIVGVLTACGGGGGGGGGITLTPPTYTGLTAAVEVSTNNSNAITERFLAQANSTDLLTAAEANTVQSATKRVLAQIKQEKSGKKNISAASSSQENCSDGGFQTITADVNELGQGTFSIDFKSCLEGNLLYIGKTSSKITGNESSSYFAINFDLAVVNTTSSKHIHISGYTEVTDTYATNTEVVKNNLMVEDVPAGKSVYQKNFTSSTVYNDIIFPSTGTTTISGELYFNDIGRVDLSTPTPISISVDRDQNEIYNSGEFLLTGANNGTIRITLETGAASHTPMSTKIGVDTNGDSILEFEGYLAKHRSADSEQVAQAVASVISTGTTTGDTITVSARDSEAPDGKALSISWSIQSKPVDSTATLSGAHAPETTFVADKAGSYTLELLVSDGVTTHAVYPVIAISNPQ